MRKKSDSDEYTSLAIKVSKFEVAVGESINVNLRTKLPFSWDDSDPVVAPDFRLMISGSCTFPEDRAGDSYQITLYGERLEREQLTFKQIRVCDEHNVPVYRKHRGREYPAFELPPGLATIARLRGTREWQTCMWVSPHTVSRMLPVVSSGRQLFVSIDECKRDRQRWVRGFAVQTTDPADE